MNFVEAVSGSPQASETLREFFQNNWDQDPKLEEQILLFRELTEDLGTSWSFNHSVPGRHDGSDLRKALYASTASCESLSCVARGAEILLGASRTNTLLSIYQSFEPVYQRLIWAPNQSRMLEIMSRIDGLLEQHRISLRLNQIRIFYGSQWPELLPFTLSLYPIPGSRGRALAENMGAFSSVGVLTERDDFAEQISILVHEMAHALYEQQPKDRQMQIANWFGNDQDSGRFASWFFNEVIATAIGNGWAYYLMTGRVNDRSWYNHPYIDPLAKAVFPLTRQYLEKSKPLDANFVDQMIKMMNDQFPNASLDPSALFFRVHLILPGHLSAFKAQDLLMHTFHMSSCETATESDDIENLLALSNTATHLVLIPVKQLTEIKNSTWSASLNLNDDFFSDETPRIQVSEDNPTTIIIVYDHDWRLESALKQLSKSVLRGSTKIMD